MFYDTDILCVILSLSDNEGINELWALPQTVTGHPKLNVINEITETSSEHFELNSRTFEISVFHGNYSKDRYFINLS